MFGLTADYYVVPRPPGKVDAGDFVRPRGFLLQSAARAGSHSSDSLHYEAIRMKQLFIPIISLFGIFR